MSTIIPEPPPEPTYRARVSFPPGLDETRLAVFDQPNERIAEVSWRHASYDVPGPAAWDWHLHALGYDRTSWWQPDEFGFACNVQPRGGSTKP